MVEPRGPPLGPEPGLVDADPGAIDKAERRIEALADLIEIECPVPMEVRIK